MAIRHRLVLGIDGSGKSTLLENLSNRDGVKTMEVTSSDEAREFKSRTRDALVTPKLISDRREIYLSLNRSFDEELRRTLGEGEYVATTGSALVTHVSHSLMHEIITGEEGGVDESVTNWVSD